MFFLHALATKRKQLEQAGDIDALMNLPIVTVFEKSASPGGVWRSDRNRDNNNNTNNAEEKPGDTDESTNMYEGLWINGHKDGMEFFDYTFEDHFKTPQPVYLPRQQILEYIMARLSKHGDIFQDVLFNTEVQSVTYDDALEQFVIVSRDKEGMISTRHFDKCIWASGTEGMPNMPEEVMNKLGDFKGQIVHSSAMDKLVGSSSDDGKNNNAVEGKRILLIGDAYSAEDLALQCVKLGAEKIYFTSRHLHGTASYMGSWPDDKVEMLAFAEVAGVKDDGTGKTIVFDALQKEYPVSDVEDVSIIIFCTGYKPNMSFIDDKLQMLMKDEDQGTWGLNDYGENATATWRMKENAFTFEREHIVPAEELESNSLFVVETLYRGLLISNPNMMYIYHLTSYPILETDVLAWLFLSYITGETPIPSKEKMLEANNRDLLESMQYFDSRYSMDEEYKKACDAVPIDPWYYHHLAPDEFEEYVNDSMSVELRVLAQTMKDANYPVSFGDMDGLNTLGAELLRMAVTNEKEKLLMRGWDDNTKKWKTFRDSDPSPFRSLMTGMSSIPLEGKWLEIDDDGNSNVCNKCDDDTKKCDSDPSLFALS